MCKYRPCWGTPQEIQKIINSGHAKNLMLDYWVGDSDDSSIYLLCPAIIDFEGGNAPLFPTGKCIFLDDDSKCKIHNIKPLEGRIAGCKNKKLYDKINLHKKVAMTWDTDEGKKIIEIWKGEYL